MSKKVQKEKPGYLCLVYGGCMKLGFVRYFPTENTPEDEFDKYKQHYGGEIKGRYIKIVNPTDAYTKVRAELAKLNVTNSFGDIYETGIASAVKIMKEATGVKKASTWGMESNDDDNDADKQANKQADKQADKPADKQADKPADKQGDAPVDAPASTNKPVTKKGKVAVKGNKKKAEVQEIDKEDEGEENNVEVADGDNEKATAKQPVKKTVIKKVVKKTT
jgi:hypothetical protein